jgi:DNA-binding beta-propeller fold protein YncE
MKKKSIFLVFFIIFLILLLLPLKPFSFAQENPNQPVYTIEDINSLAAFKSGMINYNNALYQKAIFYFKKSLSYKSKNFLARYMLGFSYYKSGFLQNALFEWETLKSFGFNDNLFLNMLESIYFQEGNFLGKILAKNFTLYQQMNGITLSKNFFLWPLGMDIDYQNRIFLTGHRSNNVLLVRNGKVDKSLTPFGVSLGYPFDIAFDKRSDFIYVSDYKNNIIYKLTYDGKIIKKIGKDFTNEQKLNGPAGICTDLAGNIYVVDQGNNRIVKINSKDEFVFSFGNIGKEISEFYKPVDIVYIPEKRELIVSNSYNNRLDIFDQWGNYKDSIESPEIVEPRGLFYPGNDYLYIVTKEKIIAYDFNTESIQTISLGSAELYEPYFCLLDKNNNLVVTEPYKQRIDFFIPQDELYLNLDVKLERLDIRNYPLIIAYISVKDQFGRTVYGLSDENFTFNENESTIKRLNSDYSYIINDYPMINLIVDTKNSMYNYRDKVNEIIEKIFSIDKSIGYSYFLTSNYEQVKSIKNDILELKEAISSKNTYKDTTFFDQVFYSAVSSFTQKFVKGGIILFTDGEFTNSSFSIHSQNDIINYAKNNYIPVYIFYFGSGNGKTFLKELAVKTNGYFFEDEELFYPDLAIKLFKNYQSPLYIVYYKTPYPYIPDFYRQVFITVQYNGRVGKNWLGYYMPEE